MENLKQYTFIKPDNLTIDEKYNLYVSYKDICGFVEMKKDEFLEEYKNKDPLNTILTYHMIKYQTTLVDFTMDSKNERINGMIVDNNIKYKERFYKLKIPANIETGDDVIFIKHTVGWYWYVTCFENENKAEDKSTLRHINQKPDKM